MKSLLEGSNLLVKENNEDTNIIFKEDLGNLITNAEKLKNLLSDLSILTTQFLSGDTDEITIKNVNNTFLIKGKKVDEIYDVVCDLVNETMGFPEY